MGRSPPEWLGVSPPCGGVGPGGGARGRLVGSVGSVGFVGSGGVQRRMRGVFGVGICRGMPRVGGLGRF